MGKPEDPMKEYILIEDDPYRLIKTANKKALFYELLSLLFISISMIVNIWIVILIIGILM